MKRIRHIITLAICVISLVVSSCNGRQEAFDLDPGTRIKESINQLTDKLSSHEEGWEVVYFPSLDSLKHTDAKKLIDINVITGYLGRGGATFVMKFDPAGVVTTYSDENEEAAKVGHKSQYLVHQTSATTLTFTTYSPIYRLVNADFQGVSDWVFERENPDGSLTFKSGQYITPLREYILFRPIKTNENGSEEVISKAVSNRRLLEEMKNPQVLISESDKIYFRSDYKMMTDYSTNKENRRNYLYYRYFLFVFSKEPNPMPDNPPLQATCLGMGFTGTSQGLLAQPGLYLTPEIIFRDFQRVEDRFECELVRVFDPATRKYVYSAQHLYPNGETIGYKAVIYDAQ